MEVIKPLMITDNTQSTLPITHRITDLSWSPIQALSQ